MTLKHKTSEPSTAAGFDLEQQKDYRHPKEGIIRRGDVPYGVIAEAYESAEQLNRSSSGWRKYGSRKSAFFGIAGLIGLVLIVEVIVVIAVIAGPTVGMIKSLKMALDVFGGQETQQFQIMLNVDSGANLTQVLTSNEALLAAGAQLLAPPAPPPPPTLQDPANALEGEGEAGEMSEEKKGVTSAEQPISRSVFLEWCQSAACMEGERDLCSVLDADLASARSPSGAPIIPLPPPFCKAVDVLSSNRCLCDADLADSQISGEAASIVKSSQLIGTLCRVEMVTPSSGKCIK